MGRPNNINTLAAPFAIRAERAGDVTAREALLDASFGAGRHARTCQRLRDGRTPADGLAFLRPTAVAWPAPSGYGTSTPAACRRWCSDPRPSIRRAAISASAAR